MFGDLTVKAQAEIIADPKKLLAQIDTLLLLPNQTPAITKTVAAIRRLVVEAVQTEYVQTHVDEEIMDKNSDYMDFVNDKLRTALGDRLVRIVGPIVTTTREE